MKNMVSAMRAALARGESVVLCAILAAEGSSPREAGAKMAVFADGSAMGTIGGGAVEFAAIALAKELLAAGGTAVRRFTLHPGEQDALNMICGGEVTVFFSAFTPDDALQAAELERWQLAVEEERTHYLRYCVVEGELPLRVVDASALLHAEVGSFAWNGETCLEKVERAARVLLFGGGHVGRALVPVLAMVGFRVWVIDEREEVAKNEYFPAAERVLCCGVEQISSALTVAEDDYVVVMTPGHQADYAILRQILKTEATYVGCIGSRRKAALTREKLSQEGFGEETIARIHSPIGLAISARTPEEIAVSITAEMIAHRANCVKE